MVGGISWGWAGEVVGKYPKMVPISWGNRWGNRTYYPKENGLDLTSAPRTRSLGQKEWYIRNEHIRKVCKNIFLVRKTPQGARRGPWGNTLAVTPFRDYNTIGNGVPHPITPPHPRPLRRRPSPALYGGCGGAAMGSSLSFLVASFKKRTKFFENGLSSLINLQWKKPIVFPCCTHDEVSPHTHFIPNAYTCIP